MQGTQTSQGGAPTKTTLTVSPAPHDFGAVTGNPFVMDFTSVQQAVGLLTGATHLAIENLAAGQIAELTLTQDPTGGHTVAWDGAGGFTITSAGSSDLLAMPQDAGAEATFYIQRTGVGTAQVIQREIPEPQI